MKPGGNETEVKIIIDGHPPKEQVAEALRVIGRTFGSEPPKKDSTKESKGRKFGLHGLDEAYERIFGHK